ncbi:translation initiation factor IF-2 [Ehrlichia ruminantium]|uniref:Translation initiation factor IF-2 n=1 Tax=Ehrlichia ruminantium (strain Welgevonden) TaxID=254945 RepID=IF2_EHRRW|nr:translation initiation factor IF-2 [Ehrlichia ruminantium]Q5HB61.1 RecName: Full=Translation initiation factor IF-2 [Ehrlichia ruminantium str. Welgevonden]QLK55146.1 translation initiation factor IF-2 [Ehrlichia ruminantium]QLK56063.1 translation initiation factor IF-2 [Ehrlichia ruminantium]UOD99275.1 translation initiation factor IF-2 [Ehrlichia ruminantium]CAH58197.1 translation initiation factor IF-2 [Ehrlichia ruminantium str. Welgevonden]CAI26985.1 Translation initiation factor IF-2
MNESKSVASNELTSGKVERTTLKLSDKLKISSNIQQGNKFSLNKSITTVEVRKSKKRKNIDEAARSSLLLQNNDIDGNSEDKNSLTIQEQISRMNALQNASNNEKREELSSDSNKHIEEEVISVKAEVEQSVDVVLPNDNLLIESDSSEKVIVDPVTDSEHGDKDFQDVVMLDEFVSSNLDDAGDQKNGDQSDDISDLLEHKGIEGKKLKKYEKEHEEKKGNPKKVMSNNTYTKHVKLVIEEELEEDNNKQVIKNYRSKKNRVTNRSVKNKITRKVLIPNKITVQELANSMSERVKDVQQVLYQMTGKHDIKLTDYLDSDQASIIVEAFNHTFKLVDNAKLENDLYSDGNNMELIPRAPVVTVMGHVDHGKTSLLDAIRESNVVDGEFKGITQHIGAYQITLNGDKKITFIDTPGHEAFAAMRAHGTNVTDIVVLVVAADDGIMPQTIESINHVKAANVAMIVAVNKIDKHDADLDRITNALLQHGVVAESLGGDVIVVPVSAKEKINLDQLKSSILLIADLLELKAVYNTRASGTVIESKVDKNCGVVATLIVQKGTLKVGDIIVAGNQAYGRVRSMFNADGGSEKVAIPSMPIKVFGLNNVPNFGTSFIVVDSEKQARELINYRQDLLNVELSKQPAVDKSNILLYDMVDELNVILKCDVMGSIEAICYSIGKITHKDIRVNILYKGVGNITKSDVLLAETSNSIILAFNVKTDTQVKELAKQKNIEIKHYFVIYDIIDDIKKILTGMLKPLKQEVQIGTLSVRKVFSVGNNGSVLGCYVTSGLVKKGALVKLVRNNNIIHEGKIKVLRRFKDDVKEVTAGFECGILLDYSKEIYPESDVMNIFEIVEEIRVIQ